ncbi:uncharacterized protein SCHCODRAFT_02707366 [Schizophyllum commune H4-8]|uniref:uncharacterized protein n=1 Tax=Schizophyllum commune (strain H4-8 / FGSC 9210) TaxID=578458 RepID=UPI00215E7753|nr:uncharacterized protein SCHCODRAFT_02707366 [Schizophyllum commune H4-8]KAI5836634.1 hypothetical protein SCHCODRAFT_02707366 [Schizophyllum commune H4-8]
MASRSFVPVASRSPLSYRLALPALFRNSASPRSSTPSFNDAPSLTQLLSDAPRSFAARSTPHLPSLSRISPAMRPRQRNPSDAPSLAPPPAMRPLAHAARQRCVPSHHVLRPVPRPLASDASSSSHSPHPSTSASDAP